MASTGGKKFRNDIEGLRGFAIALVVIFHVFVGKVSSGVDVFLLLGGVFFFGSQLANARNPKGLTFVQSLVRIIRRLFPLLAVLVGATLAAGLLLMPRIQHLQLAKDAVGALAYVTNWQLAFSGRDYNTASSTVSPFQHLWSMSAQLQIYVSSLIAVTLIALIFRRFSRKALAVILTAVTVLSFAFAAYQHGQDQGRDPEPAPAERERGGRRKRGAGVAGWEGEIIRPDNEELDGRVHVAGAETADERL